MKGDRNSFVPRLPDDANFVLCNKQMINEQVLMAIEAAFARDEPVKMVLYGDWGVGKTHILHHIQWWLEQHSQEYPADTLLIEIGDLSKKSKFDEVVRPLLDKFGLHKLIELIDEYRALEKQLEKSLVDQDVAPHVASAFAKFLNASPGHPPPAVVVQAFDYLKGRNLGKAGQAVGLVGQLEQSRDYFDVLLALGIMVRRVRGKRIIYIADEAAKLEAIEDDDFIKTHWVTANRFIFSDENSTFGFIYSASGRRRDLPLSIFEPQLQNRLGDNYIELGNLTPDDADSFVRKLIEEFVDKKKLDEMLAANPEVKQQYDAASYPFTKKARIEFLDFFVKGADSKPRDISKRLNDVAFVAGKQSKRLIDESCLRLRQM